MRPRCFDREPYRDPNAGWRYTGRIRWVTDRRDPTREVCKDVMRYRWSWFVDRCASWDNPLGHEQSVPGRERWHCHGCRWLPDAARYRATLIDSGARLAERQRTQQESAQ